MELCEKHLNYAGAWDTEIEQLLTYSLLVIIYAEIEREIDAIIERKYDSIENTSIRRFVASSRDAGTRGIKSSELANFLGRFGDEYKIDFQTRIRESQRAESYYNNLITNRHETSHASGSTATFQNVKNYYEEGHVVLDFFRDTLLAAESD